MSPKKTTRKVKGKRNVLDISQYAIATDAEYALSTAAQSDEIAERSAEVENPSRITFEIETKNSGTEALDRLIIQDIVDTPVQSHHESTRRTSRSIRENIQLIPRPHTSKHVIDLRKHFLIEKYGLHTLEKPERSFAQRLTSLFTSHRDRVQWHFPERRRPEPVREKKLYVSEKPTRENSDSGMRSNRLMPAFGFALFLILILLPVPGVRMLSSALSIKQQLWFTSLAAVSNLKAGVAGISENQYQTSQRSLSNAASDFNSIARELDSYTAALRALAPVLPSVNAKIVLARESAKIGEDAAEIASILAQGLTTVREQNSSQDSLLRLSKRFDDIALSLDRLQEVLAYIDDADVPEFLSDSLHRIKQDRTLLADGSRRISQLSELVYHITGGETYSRYLILFQNNRELRPTGGFIGSIALADFSRGTLTHLEFPGGGAYDLAGTAKQNLIPPEPISILNPKWFIWDANWWPDFPTSARKIAALYDDSRGTTLNGVIAVNATVIQRLLSITGPISLPDYGVTVSEDTFFDVIQKYVEQQYDVTENQPKKILRDLMPIMIERLTKTAQYRDLFLTVASALRSRDVQIAVFDDAEQASKVRKLGWDGSLKANDRDFLSVVTSNIAGGKSDESIYDTLTHAATVQDSGDIIVTTSISREHRASPIDPLAYVNHVDYIRFYVPLGSTLLDAKGFARPDDHYFKRPSDSQVADPELQSIQGQQVVDLRNGVTISAELNHTVFAHWLQVQPGGRVEASITYKLPFAFKFASDTGVDWFSDWYNAEPDLQTYSLLVQKQAGKHNVILNSSVTLPDSLRIVWSGDSALSGSAAAPRSFTYSSTLDADVYYAVLIGKAPKTGAD